MRAWEHSKTLRPSERFNNIPLERREMTEIRPGIYQFKVPIPDNPLGNTNTYLVRGDGENLLIDTGWNGEEAFQALKRQLNEIGINFTDITRIVVTHAHGDHYGLTGRLKQVSPATISLHYLDKEFLAPRFKNREEFIRQTEQWLKINGVPASELSASWTAFGSGGRLGLPAPPDNTLNDEDTVTIGSFNLKVIWTPGHSPGHICLYEPDQKILFSGDHVLPVITPNVSLQPHSDNNPLGSFLNSLNKVKQLDTRLVLPAHEHIFTDLPARVDEIVQHHRHRNSEILETIKSAPKTAYQISTVITWMPELGGVRFRDLAPWDKRMAVSETLAHLEALRGDGIVAKSHRDGIVYYQRA